MATAVFLACGLLICQVRSQCCSPNIFPGLLGLDSGLYGPGPLGPLSPQIGLIPPCGPQAPPCGNNGPCGLPSCAINAPCSLPAPCGLSVPPYSYQGPIGVPSCGVQVPCGIPAPCGIQAPSCGAQLPSCGVQTSPCGVQVPSCGIQTPPCGVQVPQCGLQVPSCGVQVPSCGIQVPQCGVQIPSCLQSPIINTPLIPNQPCQCAFPNKCNQCFGSIAPIVPSCDYQNPVTTVIDNTLANSLANALQLLIVSNLLESTLGSNLAYPCDVITNPFANIIDITPECPCNQIVSCDPVFEVLSSVSQYCDVPCQEPLNFAPCVDIPCAYQDFSCDYGVYNPYANAFGNFGLDGLNTYVSNYGFDCGMANPFVNGFDCGMATPFVNGFDYGLANQFSNGFDCGLVNPFASGYGYVDNVFSPCAAEVLFPSEIPAQLTCNFGYMANNVPCVSVNVETLPFDSCCNNVVY